MIHEPLEKPEYYYIHSSMYGTYHVPCIVIARASDGTKAIRFIDPWSNEEITKWVDRREVKYNKRMYK